MFRDFPQRDPAMENTLCVQSLPVLQWACGGRARRCSPQRQQTSLCGRIVPEAQVLKVCKQCPGPAEAHGIRKFTKSEALKASLWNFIFSQYFWLRELMSPTKNKKCLENPLPHVSRSSFDPGMSSCFDGNDSRRKCSSQTFWPHLYLNFLSVEMSKAHVSRLPALTLPDVNISVVPKRRKWVDVLSGLCQGRTKPEEWELRRSSREQPTEGGDGWNFLERAKKWNSSIDYIPRQVNTLFCKKKLNKVHVKT